jgi:small-conductance mechanosensitive channel
VGIAYGTDIDHAADVMVEAAESVDIVLDSPRPRARFRAFGDSALEFEVLCWGRHPVQRGRGTHLVNTALYQAFEEADIEILFPQRHVHLARESLANGAESEQPMGNDYDMAPGLDRRQRTPDDE